MSKGVLCIGGPMDGQRLESKSDNVQVPIQRSVGEPVFVDSNGRSQLDAYVYSKQRIRLPCGDLELFVSNGVSIDTAIDKMVAVYELAATRSMKPAQTCLMNSSGYSRPGYAIAVYERKLNKDDDQWQADAGNDHAVGKTAGEAVDRLIAYIERPR